MTPRFTELMMMGVGEPFFLDTQVIKKESQNIFEMRERKGGIERNTILLNSKH